jgi:hypothetical protein
MVLLVGKDLYKLMDRLPNPVRCWNDNRRMESLTVWVAVVMPGRERYEHSSTTASTDGQPNPHMWLMVIGDNIIGLIVWLDLSNSFILRRYFRVPKTSIASPHFPVLTIFVFKS